MNAGVKAVVLLIDSPGGSVNCTPSLSAAVRSVTKPIVALADGTMASAAYWIGSGADAVYATELTAQIGSIGIVATHRHQPASNGRVLTEVSSGKYKRIASPNKPLDAEGAAYVQAQVDHLQTVFLSAVAENRGVSLDQAQAMAGEGRIYIGQQAVDAGLIDGIRSINSVVAQLSSGTTSIKRRTPAPGSTTPAAANTSAPAYAATVVARLGLEHADAVRAPAAVKAAPSAAESMVDVFCRANRAQSKPEVRERLGRATHSPVVPAATSTRAPIASVPRPDAARASACHAVAQSAIALFIKFQGEHPHD